MQYTYSLILFFTVVICFVASFDRRLRFDREFVPFLKASGLVAVFFIAWDIWFTSRGVWWFDTHYTLGLVIGGLPLEEWLFFIFIPFSCIFTYFCIDKFFRLQQLSALNNLLVFVSVIVCAVVALRYADRIYTVVTAVVTILTLLTFHFVLRVEWITQASLVFTLLMLGFLPVNGILTGTGLESPIVNYNPSDFMGIRILTIPIEDAVYGYAQFLLVLYFFKKFQSRQRNDHSLVPNSKNKIMDRNHVVLVDENDQPIGQMNKLAAHEQGLLHRAFSIFIFNSRGELLLQQRAFDKYHGGGLWTNTCCSHPQYGEDLLESAQERLSFEMGIFCELTFSFAFIYYAKVENNLIEYEYDHVFTGYLDTDPILNPKEAAAFRWSPVAEVLADISVHPEQYTYWFKEALPQVINQIKQRSI